MKVQTKLFLLITGVCFSLIGCASTTDINYSYGLTSVERPEDTAQRYGDYIITEQSEETKDKFLYEDDLIKSIWYVGSKNIVFDITNKTNSSIKIIWDEAAFVDVEGTTSRVMHLGTKYIDRNNSQPASVIVRKGSISDLIIPNDNIYYSSGQYGGWRELPLLKTNFTDDIEAKLFADKYIGKSIQVLLPLEIGGKINDYIFIFDIENYSVSE